jgi:hypothetical protein
MSNVLTLEFADATVDQYYAVSKLLGVDITTGDGDWPKPLLSHTVSYSEAGGLQVIEVWESEEAQAEFMGRLGPALGQVGVPQPTRTEWRSHLGSYTA